MDDQEMRIVSVPKKLWHVVRVFLYMLKKGIRKKKLLLDLNLLLQRGKLASKAALIHLPFFAPPPSPLGEYEFSCSNTPVHPNLLLKRKGRGRPRGRAPAPPPHYEDTLHVMVALEAASPLLPGLGFGRSPLVRQLRVTDSPYPVEAGDCHVDEAAEEFIRRFYSQLRTQSITDS